MSHNNPMSHIITKPILIMLSNNLYVSKVSHPHPTCNNHRLINRVLRLPLIISNSCPIKKGPPYTTKLHIMLHPLHTTSSSHLNNRHLLPLTRHHPISITLIPNLLMLISINLHPYMIHMHHIHNIYLIRPIQFHQSIKTWKSSKLH